VRRAAASTVALENSESGFALMVAMVVLSGLRRDAHWCAATISF
jgi:hypothetical protein